MKLRLRGLLGLAALCLLGAALIAGAWLAVRRVASLREYEAAVDRYRAAGCPMDPVAMKPAPLPPGRNGVDRYLRALGLGPDSFRVDPPESKEFVSTSDPRLDVPEGAELSEQEWKDRRALVLDFGSQIKLLKEAAAAEEVQYPLHYEERWSMLMPHVSRLIAAAKLLQWDVRLSAIDGKSAQAWEGIDAMFAAGDSVAAETPLVSQLVRLAVLEQGLDALESVLDRLEPPSEAQRARLEKRFAPDRLQAGMRQSCSMEVGMTHDTMAQFFKGGTLFPELDQHRTGWGGFLVLPEYYRGAARCLDRLVRVHGMLDHPPATAIGELEAVLGECRKDPKAFSFLFANFAIAVRRERVVSARLLLAREAVRIRFGSRDLPSLPESVPALPPDPLSGRPLKYLKTAKGFTLQVDLTDAERETPWKLEKPLIWACPR